MPYEILVALALIVDIGFLTTSVVLVGSIIENILSDFDDDGCMCVCVCKAYKKYGRCIVFRYA